MKLTKEQLIKAKSAKNAGELIALAKENGIGLTAEDAAKYFAELHREGDVSDEELENVSGGGFFCDAADGKTGAVADYF